MLELIFSTISLVIFLFIAGIIVFRYYGVINKKDKKIKIIQNALLIVLAIMQVILMRYSNFSGCIAHFITMCMSFYLLE